MSKKSHYHRIVRNETLIEVGKSNKTLNITNRNWGSLVNNGLNLPRIHANTISKDDVIKEFHFDLMKFTFLHFGIKFDFLKLVQNKSNISFVLFQVFGEMRMSSM